ncbi:hypothetical protein [Paludisphaera sp.]|uniref:hypothetical protein n=1 Tax=Paludisphaera sp. TaxID=2017432 RepID=UPI00301C13E7
MTTASDAERIARAFADPAALERLRRRHREEARADLSRVHPTWLARALLEESPAVRATVATRGPEGLARLLRGDGPPPRPDRPPHPEVLEWVMALWTERLVGGSDRDDDPPVIVGLTRTTPIEAFRLWRAVGRIKSALAGAGGPSPEVRDLAGRDVKAARDAGATGRRGVALLGLATAFRLLAECEPFAARRALQRIPYPIVRQARSIAPPTARIAPAVTRLEARILREAWDRLRSEGRIAIPHPPGGRP